MQLQNNDVNSVNARENGQAPAENRAAMCVHEAAHAVARFRVGYPLRYVAVHHGPASFIGWNGDIHRRVVGVVEGGTNPENITTLEDASRSAVVSLAGPVAAMVYARRMEPAEADARAVRDLVLECDIFGSCAADDFSFCWSLDRALEWHGTRRALWNSWIALTSRLLRSARTWRGIHALADKLYRDVYCEGAEAERIVRKAMRSARG